MCVRFYHDDAVYHDSVLGAAMTWGGPLDVSWTSDKSIAPHKHRLVLRIRNRGSYVFQCTGIPGCCQRTFTFDRDVVIRMVTDVHYRPYQKKRLGVK